MKEKIMRETFRLLLDKGLYGVSISDIQNAVGASRANIYHHFKNKDDLFFNACMYYCVKRYLIPIEELKHSSTKEVFLRMHNIRSELIDELSREDGERVSVKNYNLIFYQASQKFPELMTELKLECDKFEYHIRLAQKNGEIRKDIDSAFLIRLYFYTFDGAPNYVTGIESDSTREEDIMLEEIMRLYDMIKVT